MEARTNIKQLVQPAEQTAEPEEIQPEEIEEILKQYVPDIGVFTVEDTNNKAIELTGAYGSLLISYSSKVMFKTSANVFNEIQNVYFISKRYNKYSVTTSRHQSEFKYMFSNSKPDINIYLADADAQRIFNAAFTNHEVYKIMEENFIKQYEREQTTLNQVKNFQEVLNTPILTAERKAEIWESLKNRLSFNLKLINVTDEQLKTVNNQYAYYQADNIKFTLKQTWTKGGKRKNIKIIGVTPTYGSLLTD